MLRDDYFIGMAQVAASRSKDTNTQVGAVLVDADDKVVATGYNGMIKGCDESYMWGAKHAYVIHAEMNALLYAGREARGCQMYITHAPCSQCLKHMFQAGIKVIHYNTLTTKSKRPDAEVNTLRVMMESTNCLVRNVNNGKTLKEELSEA